MRACVIADCNEQLTLTKIKNKNYNCKSPKVGDLGLVLRATYSIFTSNLGPLQVMDECAPPHYPALPLNKHI